MALLEFLRTLRNVVQPRIVEDSGGNCPACGERFSCGVNWPGCWCAEVKLTDAARANLREQYRGCLCRACLETIANAPRAD